VWGFFLWADFFFRPCTCIILFVSRGLLFQFASAPLLFQLLDVCHDRCPCEDSRDFASSLSAVRFVTAGLQILRWMCLLGQFLVFVLTGSHPPCYVPRSWQKPNRPKAPPVSPSWPFTRPHSDSIFPASITTSSRLLLAQALTCFTTKQLFFGFSLERNDGYKGDRHEE